MTSITSTFKALGRRHIASAPLKNKTRGLTSNFWRGRAPLAETHPGTRSPGARTGCKAARCTGVGARKRQGLTRPQATTRRSPSAQASFRQKNRQRTRCGAPSHKPQGVDADALIGEAGGTLGSIIWLLYLCHLLKICGAHNHKPQGVRRSTPLLARLWAPSDQSSGFSYRGAASSASPLLRCQKRPHGPLLGTPWHRQSYILLIRIPRDEVAEDLHREEQLHHEKYE